jgi:hypothetical protein
MRTLVASGLLLAAFSGILLFANLVGLIGLPFTP